jgi:hypothetical protein
LDCKHPTAYQLTHHLKGKNERVSMNMNLRGDTSTEAVLNAIKRNDVKYNDAKFVSSNHFDVDSFLSVWCAINPTIAMQYAKILREAARIGDFRELRYYLYNLYYSCL